MIKAFLSTLVFSTVVSAYGRNIGEQYVKIQELLAEVTRVSTSVTKMTNPPAAAAVAQSNPQFLHCVD